MNAEARAELLGWAGAIVDATENMPDGLESNDVETIAIELSGLLYQTFQDATNAAAAKGEEPPGEEEFVQVIADALRTAVIAGFLIAVANQPTQAETTISAQKEGKQVYITINV